MPVSKKARDELLTLLLEYIPDENKVVQFLGRALRIDGNESYRETIRWLILAVDDHKRSA